MASRQAGEEVKESGPYEDEEKEHQEEDSVSRDVLGGEKVEPVTSVRR